jgi:TolB-like protein
MLQIGERFDRYTIEALLGQGGMGEVYRAFDAKLERRVALKILRAEDLPSGDEPAGSGSAGRARSLLREARAAAQLEHPNVIAIFDVGEADGVTFLAMELIQGHSLRELIGGPASVATRLSWLVDVARALALAQRRGLVHRDIKPENVMVRDDGVIKVLDFGIAHRARVQPEATLSGAITAATATLGNESRLMGTPLYMAPEQMYGGLIDGRTDQFAWGVLAYELLSAGQLPWPDAYDLLALVAAIMSRDPRPLPLVPDLPPGVPGVVMRALRRSPGDRYASMDDVITALGDAAAESARSAPDAALRGSIPVAPAVLAETMQAAPAHALRLAGRATPVSSRPVVVGPAEPASSHRRRRLAAGVLAAVLVGAGAAAILARPARATIPVEVTSAVDPDGGATRRSVAVLGFKNLAGREDAAWIGTALCETVSSELATSQRIRTIATTEVSRMTHELALGDPDTLGPELLERVGRRLGTELVVTGSYLAIGGKIRLDARLVDVKTGATIASVSESDRESELIELVERVGASLRRDLRAGELSAEELSGVRASQPATPEAARAYAEGLAKLRASDVMGARASFERVVELEPRFALGHAALADALLGLGMSEAAAAPAQRALQLSQTLPREERMMVELRSHEATGAWAKVIEVARMLHELFPDNLDYGLHLAHAQIEAGKPEDAVVTLTALRGLPAPLGDDARIDLAEVEALENMGDLASEERVAEAALAKAEAVGATTVAARARIALGWKLINSGEADRGLEHLRLAEESAKATGDTALQLEVLDLVASARAYQGKNIEAVAAMEELLQRSRDLGNPSFVMTAYSNIATLDIPLARLDDAQRAAASASRAVSPSIRAIARLLSGRVSALRGELGKARASYGAAIQSFRESHDERDLGWALAFLGELELDQDHLDEAATLARESLATRERAGLTLFAGESRLLLARVLFARGARDDADQEAKAALATFVKVRAGSQEALALAFRARVLAQTGQAAAAAEPLARARELTAASQDVLARLDVEIAGGVVAAAIGRGDDAAKPLDAAIDEATRLGLARFTLDARLARARAGHAAEARAALAKVARDAEKAGFGGVAREARAAR